MAERAEVNKNDANDAGLGMSARDAEWSQCQPTTTGAICGVALRFSNTIDLLRYLGDSQQICTLIVRGAHSPLPPRLSTQS